MNKIKCLVLGANGFVGSNLVKELSKLNDLFEITIFSKESEVIPNVKCVKGDFTRDADLMEAVNNIDVIFHLISSSNPARSEANPFEAYQVDLLQSLKLLEISRERGVKKIIFVSSGGTVYGNHEYLPIDENHQTNPMNNYGISKLAIEKLLLKYNKSYGMKNLILRLANPYGSGQNKNKNIGAVTIFLSKILNEETITIFGGGNTVRDYIYIDDVISALISSATYLGVEEVFNIGTGKGTSLIELISLIEYKLKKKAIIEYVDSRSIDAEVNILSIDKAKRELGFYPKYSLEQGIDKYTEFMSMK